MPLLGFDIAFIDHAKVPALRNALKACEEDRFNDALELVRAAQGRLTPHLAATLDLYALIQRSRGFVDDALADAIDNYRNFPHLAIGYNRASELYMQKGQGLSATEVYEAGLKAIGEEGNPQQMSLLQKHRQEMELKYRDFIALLPLQITERIFQEFDEDFRIKICTTISTAWLPKAAYNVDGSSMVGYELLPAAHLARIWKYIGMINIWACNDDKYLVKFFCELSKQPRVGKYESLKIRFSPREHPADLHKIMAPSLARISQSLTSLRVDFDQLISPADLLAACPNLTTLEYACDSCLASTQKTIPKRDKLTQLIIYTRNEDEESFIRDLQTIIKATPNVRFANLRISRSKVLRIAPQYWRKLRLLSMIAYYELPLDDQILEGDDVLDMQCNYFCLSDLYEYICQERMRLSSLTITMDTTMPAEITAGQFQVLRYINIDCCETHNSWKSAFLEVIRGAVATLEELVLCGTAVPPETYEALTLMPRLEKLKLDFSDCTGIGVYLEHLASLGTSSPLKSITIHNWAFDADLGTILATRIPTLEEINILTNIDRDLRGDTWILPLLEGLVHSKSKVERMSLPDYAVTTEVSSALCNLSELRELELVLFVYSDDYHHSPSDYYDDLRSCLPHVNIKSSVTGDPYFWET